jgi:predicted NUDIX family NTP pyrophosphohydrolase
LVYRTRDAGPQVLLAHMGGPLWSRKDEHAWTIPKGEYTADEDPLAAARREFAEELGSPPPDGPWLELGEVRQSGGKTVTAWAVEGEFDPETAVSNTFELEWPPRSGRLQSFPEIDRVAWFDVDTARAKLIAAQVAFLDRLVDAMA